MTDYENEEDTEDPEPDHHGLTLRGIRREFDEQADGWNLDSARPDDTTTGITLPDLATPGLGI